MTHPPVLDGDLTQLDRQQAARQHSLRPDRWPRPRQPPQARCLHGLDQGRACISQCKCSISKIETVPATAWWWTRDNIELFRSTRPVAADQINYDIYCHQFFVVPEDPSANNVAIVGQWHRDGDALKDNLIPEPAIQKAVKILPDRYVVELFIPATAMHGYNPSHQPKLAFNLHVRDFNVAADFFWSAPKSSRTELRPNTWGSLYPGPAAVSGGSHQFAAQARIN